jgi:hypothetical protein
MHRGGFQIQILAFSPAGQSTSWGKKRADASREAGPALRDGPWLPHGCRSCEIILPSHRRAADAARQLPVARGLRRRAVEYVLFANTSTVWRCESRRPRAHGCTFALRSTWPTMLRQAGRNPGCSDIIPPENREKSLSRPACFGICWFSTQGRRVRNLVVPNGVAAGRWRFCPVPNN